MAEALETELRNIFASLPIAINVVDCQSHEAMRMLPVTKVSICYIVAVILFNDSGQVLMVQEAKRQCHGRWYLPAGRLECNENLVDGAKREVKEEAGLECEVTTLISVMCVKTSWMRFTFIGKITGGSLKTTAEADKESLQAQFFNMEDIYKRHIRLRAGDIIPLLHQAEIYRKMEKPVPLHPLLLPIVAPHSYILHRPVIVAEIAGEERLYIFASLKEAVHIPVCAASVTDYSLFTSMFSILKENLSLWNVCGLLSVEHCGTMDTLHDGICLTSLVSLALPAGAQLPMPEDDSFTWQPLTDQDLLAEIRKRLGGHIVPLSLN